MERNTVIINDGLKACGFDTTQDPIGTRVEQQTAEICSDLRDSSNGEFSINDIHYEYSKIWYRSPKTSEYASSATTVVLEGGCIALKILAEQYDLELGMLIWDFLNDTGDFIQLLYVPNLGIDDGEYNCVFSTVSWSSTYYEDSLNRYGYRDNYETLTTFIVSGDEILLYTSVTLFLGRDSVCP